MQVRLWESQVRFVAEPVGVTRWRTHFHGPLDVTLSRDALLFRPARPV
jgi:hypothetical protein